MLTPASRGLVGEEALRVVSKNPVYCEDRSTANASHDMAHIELARWAQYLLVCPASANTIAKLANGIADNLLTTLKERLAQPGQSMIPLLTSMSRFAKYSLANQMLIVAQRPDATCVQGYRAWNKAGYQVRKGERGMLAGDVLEQVRRCVNPPDA